MKNFKLLFPLLVPIFFFLLGCNNKSQKSENIKVAILDTISFDNLSQRACDYLKKQQDSCETIYKLSTYQNWYYDQATGQLTFSDSGIIKLIIDYEEVGSVSEATNTFLWAWANPHLEEKIKGEIVKVETYGRKRAFEKLINPKWTANQVDGWEMTAISSYLLQTKGAYRIPSSDGKLFSFFIFKNIRWADTTHVQ